MIVLIIGPTLQLQKVLIELFINLGYCIVIAPDFNLALIIFSKLYCRLVIIDEHCIKANNISYYLECRKIFEKTNTQIFFIKNFLNTSKEAFYFFGHRHNSISYFFKPFSTKKLYQKVQNLTKNPIKANANSILVKTSELRIHNLIFFLNKRSLLKGKKEIKLTAIEFKILILLIYNSGTIVSRLKILTYVWGYIPQRISDRRIVDCYISKLRAKIEPNPFKPKYILTERNKGYIFQKSF